MPGCIGAACISKILHGAQTTEQKMVERRRRRRKKKKVRWKRMYVGHVAAGIASMCHRGNHAGNAEAHLTALPSCIQLPPSYSVYIYCLRASTNRVSSTALSFPLAITYRTSLRFSQHALTRKFVRYDTYRSSQISLMANVGNLFREKFLVPLLLYFLPFKKEYKLF